MDISSLLNLFKGQNTKPQMEQNNEPIINPAATYYPKEAIIEPEKHQQNNSQQQQSSNPLGGLQSILPLLGMINSGGSGGAGGILSSILGKNQTADNSTQAKINPLLEALMRSKNQTEKKEDNIDIKADESIKKPPTDEIVEGYDKVCDNIE